ncbi:hypothetical protein CRUP_009538 [Coryphaenoides rupestris]|nr:hypothetical protein CRUP_009538 [Coryphaenoides rupestris]
MLVLQKATCAKRWWGGGGGGGGAGDWRTASDPATAAWLFSQELMESQRHLSPLHLNVDIRNGRQHQDNDLVSFYKRPGIQWASPLKCKLTGDDAIGRSVSRHLFSTVMFKLRSGLHFNLVFEGQTDHLVPSTCERLLAGDAFATAGRMLGHAFLHGGPSMPGLSPALLHVLLGGAPDGAPVVLEDCPDIDLRDSITLLSRSVLGRTAPQGVGSGQITATTLRRTDRRPHAAAAATAGTMGALVGDRLFHMILDHIVWPSAITVMLEGDDEPESDDDEEEDHEDVGRICGYLRMFIENASSAELKSLLKFWTGWEVPAERLQLAVVDAAPLPSSLACFEMLRLPRCYVAYDTFARELHACVTSVSTAGGYAFS